MRRDRADTQRMIDERVSKCDPPVQDVDDRNAAFGPLQCIAQSAGRVEVDCDDFETTCGGGSAQRITAGCLSDTTF